LSSAERRSRVQRAAPLDSGVVVVARERHASEFADLGDAPLGFCAVAHDVAEADQDVDIVLLERLKHGLKGVVVAVDVTEYSVAHLSPDRRPRA